MLFMSIGAGVAASPTNLQDGISRLAAHDCSTAKHVFEQIALRTSDRSVAARALLYEAFCEEEGARPLAVQLYKRVLARFADDTEAVAAARARLARLGFPTGQWQAEPILRYVDSIPLPEVGFDILATENNELWVTHYNAGEVTVFDAARRRMIRRITTRPGPTALALSPDRKTIYVAQRSGGVSAIERMSGKLTVLGDNRMVTDVTVEPRSGELFLAMCDAGVQALNPLSGFMRPLYGGRCPWVLALTPDGSRLYVSFQGGGPGGRRGHDVIARFNVRTGKLENVIKGFPNVGCDLAITPDGRWLWERACDACSSVTLDRQGCPAVPTEVIYVFDLRTEQIVDVLTFSELHATTIHFSPDSHLAVVPGYSLLVFDAQTRRLLQRLEGSDPYGPAAFDPSGRRLYVIQQRSVKVYEIHP